MNKIIKYIIIIIAIFLIIWFSLDIQSLDKYKASLKPKYFDATEYAENFWNNKLPVAITNAPNITDLVQLINENPEFAFEKYGHKLGISKTWYFMVKSTGTIIKIENEFLVLEANNQTSINILTDFIYGNAVRDGSGCVNIDEFLNMTDFNNVSIAINKLVKEKVAKNLKKTVKPGQQIEFAGAMEINEENIDLSSVSIIPVSVKILNAKSE